MGVRVGRSRAGRLLTAALLITAGVVTGGVMGTPGEGAHASTVYPPLDDVIDVEAGGAFACAIVNPDPNATTGSVWCWGDNFDQQLGIDDSNVNRSEVAIEVVSVASGFTNTAVSQLALGDNHACAVEAGELYCWGSNEFGKAGAATGSYSSFGRVSEPTLVAKPSGVTSWDHIALGKNMSCALTTKGATSGVLICWGHGNYIGNGKFHNLALCTNTNCTNSPPPQGNDLNNPTPVELPDVAAAATPNVTISGYSMFYNVANSGFGLLDVGPEHACATKQTGAEAGLYCWGTNSSVQTNWNADYGGMWKPAKFTGSPNPSPMTTFDGSGATQLGVSSTGACIEKTSGVFCMGIPNDEGGSPNYRAALDSSNAPVVGFTGLALDPSQLSGQPLGCGLRSGSIWCFGDAQTSAIAPAPSVAAQGEMPASTGVTDVSIGGKSGRGLSCAVNAGNAFCWGTSNSAGQLGNGTTTSSATPVKVRRTPPPPEAPTNLVATPGDGEFTVTFTPGNTNGWPVTNHQYSLDGGTTWSYASPATLTGPIRINRDHGGSGISNGQSYTIVLRAADGNAFTPPTITGATSTSVSVTPVAPTRPGVPTGVSAVAGDGSVTVSWTAPASDGGLPISGYTAQVVGNPSFACTAGAQESSCEITGLTNGTSYQFEVSAANMIGSSQPSSPSAAVTPAAASSSTDGSTGSGGSGTSTGSGSGGSGTSASSDSGDSSSSGDDTSSSSSATASGDLTAPAAGSTSSVVSEEETAALTTEPGDTVVLVDGTEVTSTVQRVSGDAATTAPEQRTAEQVAAIQTAAKDLVDTFNATAGSGSTIAVENTATGAVITGLFTEPVPVEQVVIITAGQVTMMMVSADDAGDPIDPLSSGSSVLRSKGSIAVAAAGLPANATGEIVLLPARTVIAGFTTDADGTLNGRITLPESLPAGEHTMVIAAGTTRIGLGITAEPSGAVLPATGGSHPIGLALLLLGAGVFLTALLPRRQESLAQRVPGA